MPRLVERLSQREIKRLLEVVKPGRFADGDGLYLQLPEKSWVTLYRAQGRRWEMGLGPLRQVSLEDARVENAKIRRQLAEGIDHLAERQAAQAKARLEAAKAMTFTQCAKAYVKAHRAGWRNVKHAAQWTATLSTYADPVIGALPVQSIINRHWLGAEGS